MQAKSQLLICIGLTIFVLFSGCTQQVQNQTEPLNNNTDAEVTLPIQVVQTSKANFSAVVHPMNIENPQWKGETDASGVYHTTIKYRISSENGIDEYRLNITKNAIKEALAELESLSSLKFQEVDDADLKILIRKSITESEKPDKNSLGIYEITEAEKVENVNFIRKARIEVVPMLACAAEIEVMHEILHSLGFAHGTETNSIMYAYAYKDGPTCSPKMVDSIKTSLQALYP